jgi:signal transduction histidine kinase
MTADDSKRKELIQQLTLEIRASEARFHNIVSISTDGIVIVDGFGTILFVNPAAISLFGRKAVNLLGEPFGFPIVAGATTELEIANSQRKGTVAEMRVVATEWEGKPACLATLRDITERIFAELEIKTLNMNLAEKADELEAANQELDAFNYTVAHDLAQPLHDLNICCQSIKQLCGDQLQAKCLSYAEDALKATSSMDHLIKDLLNYSRTGRVELRPQMVVPTVTEERI